MTVIAWDGKTLAADRQATSAGLVYETTKVARVGDLLVGSSGSAPGMAAFRAWIEAGADTASFPRGAEDYEAVYAIVIHRDGTVHRYENTGWPITDESAFVCSGSGRDFAMAALHLGKTAAEAVALTCELSADCGLGIDTLTFDDVFHAE